MRSRCVFGSIIIACILLGDGARASAQQKPQWMPGQMGLNAGILPSPGFTFVNLDINYDASEFNGPNGNAIPVTGTYDVWAVENIFYYVLNKKVLGGDLGFMVMFPTFATGSLVADISILQFPDLTAAAGGRGLADLWVQPLTLGWHLKRADIIVGDGFMVPTGRYSAGATDNVGTGYFGNHFLAAATFYITKNKGTAANVFTDWEVHGDREGTNGTSKTPGQAFTTEWGLGQTLPLKKDMSQLLQVGLIGYDQWQVGDDGGTIPVLNTGLSAPASLLPHYSVHAIGGQLNYILPEKNFSLFFKYEHEYQASSHTQGNTIVFGPTWTWRNPKPAPPTTKPATSKPAKP